jgi:hypothetical protein
MKATNKSILYTIVSFFILILYVANSFAEHCFEIPYKEVHDDSKEANKNVFESGILLYMSFEQIERKKFRIANLFIEIIKENSVNLIELYTKILKEVKVAPIQIYRLSPERRHYLNFVLKRLKYDEPRNTKQLIEIGLKQIEIYSKNVSADDIIYRNDRKTDRSTMIKTANMHKQLINLGFLVSEIAYQNVK